MPPAFIANPLPIRVRRPRARPTCRQLPPSAYTTLPDATPLCRLIPPLPTPPTATTLHTLLDAGFQTFTLPPTPADLPPTLRPPHLVTRLTVHPSRFPRVTRRAVERLVDDALSASRLDCLHLLQLSWRDRSDARYVDFLGELSELRRAGKIRSVGVVDFPTEQLRHLHAQRIPVSSNQVSFSLLDTRPTVRLQAFCAPRGIALLAHAPLCGGLFTERYLGVPAPRRRHPLAGLVRAWGGWSLFQELLYAVKTVADQYDVSMANVAVRWVLQRGVCAVFVGGGAEYASSNVRAFEFELTEEDRLLLERVAKKGNDLYSILGDSGSELQSMR